LETSLTDAHPDTLSRHFSHRRLVTSIVAEAELQYAPAKVREVFADTFNEGNILDTSIEIEELANAYLDAEVVPRKYVDDALHVAMATVHGVRQW